MGNIQYSRELYFGAIVEMAKLVEVQDIQTAFQRLEQLRTMEESLEDFPVFGHVVDALSLTPKDSLLLSVCVAQWGEWKPVPTWGELVSLYKSMGGEMGEQLSTVLDPSGGILPMVLDFIFGRTPKLPEWAELIYPSEGKVFHHENLIKELPSYMAEALDSQTPVVFALTGKKGTGRRFLVGEIGKETGCGVLYLTSEKARIEDVPWLTAMASIWGTIICIVDFKTGDMPVVKEILGRVKMLFVTAEEIGRFGTLGGSSGRIVGLVQRKIGDLTPIERQNAMKDLLGNWVEEQLLVETAGVYHLSMEQIVSLACRLQGEANGGKITKDLFLSALRDENTRVLRRSGELLSSNKFFGDVILPTMQKEQLISIRECVKNKARVYDDWGFGEKIPYGRGIAALFYGSSGTGKTLAATALANELGLPLYRVDLSQLTSKYVGETQKNIGRIFDEAQGGDCILFFDEADALFGRRTDGGDAQDKYINGEVAYLLQRTESYDGVMILATNLLQNFDEAFRRRIQYMIHFPLPDMDLREVLWKNIFPEKAPKEEIDYFLLASELELSGAGIRNIALATAYTAVSLGKKIDTASCVQAARLEYSKQGKAFPHRLDSIFPQERRN